ncbi:MAG TPA: hypothetical protein VK021_06770 [Flavobacteriaceae bacterium]|nr:hypothetical protein [Flavobacteriaceae bacterium]
MRLIVLYLRLNNFLVLQPGELPIPKDAKPDQKFGNYSLSDFISANWFFLLAILLLVFLVFLYLRDKKKEEKRKQEERDRARMN